MFVSFFFPRGIIGHNRRGFLIVALVFLPFVP